MQMDTEDYLKKALLDTQERVRDFMNYSEKMKSTDLKQFFRECAETEGLQARKLQGFLDSLSH